MGTMERRSAVRLTGMTAVVLLAIAGAAALLVAADADAAVPPLSASPAGSRDFGNYKFLDNTDPSGDGPSAAWAQYDIWATGTNVLDAAFASPDTFAGPFPIGFSSPSLFYATAPNQFYVNENGYIGFVLADLPTSTPPAPPPPASFTPATIPSTASPNNYIAGLFTNLAFKGCSGTIRYETIGAVAGERELVVQWTDIPLYAPPAPCGPGVVTFQIRLRETTGDVLIVLKDVVYTPAAGGTGQGTLIGIEESGDNPDNMDPADDHGLQYFFQGPSDTSAVDLSNRAVLFYRDYRPVAVPYTVTLDEDCTAVVPTTGCVSPAVPADLPLLASDYDDSVSGYCLEAEPLFGTLANGPPLCSSGLVATTGVAPFNTFTGMTYAPDNDYCNGPSYTTPDTLTYRAKDNGIDAPPAAPAPGAPLYSKPATITLQVTCRADTPVAVADTYTMNEDCSAATASSCGSLSMIVGTGCLVPPWNMKCNDSDPDDILDLPLTPRKDAALVTLVAGPTSGTLKKFDGTGSSPAVTDNGSFRYRPNANFCGPDLFTYQLEDNDDPSGMTPLPAYGNIETVTVTVTCINDIPTAAFTKPASVQVGDLASFNDVSTDPDGLAEIDTWAWDFDDGTTSNLRFPMHSFSSAGDYIVCLTVQDVADATSVGCSIISVTNVDYSSGPDPEPGTPEPGAVAGDDKAASEGDKVVLEGAANGVTVVSWHWTQVSGPAVELMNANQQDAYFTAPSLPGKESVDLVFSLVIYDGTHDSVPDTIVVTIHRANNAPVAKAGGSIQAYEGDAVILDGSLSSDADGDALTFAWTPRTGTTPSLLGAETATPTFTVPAASVGRTFVYSLEVSDGKDSNIDTVQVIVVSRLFTGAGFTAETLPDGTVTVTPVVPSESYVWDFGDDSDPIATTGSGPITHAYGAAGTFTIRLTAVGEDGSVRNFEELIPITLPAPAEEPAAQRPAPRVASHEPDMPVWGWFAGGGFVLLVLLAILAIAVWKPR